ncbi:MAG: hypothetical protein AAGF71_12805 [Pseudomonadota bacterium]
MAKTIHDLADGLSALVTEKLSVRASDLTLQVDKIGRRAPRRVKRDLWEVANAAEMARHPRLAARFDVTPVQAAHRRAETWLKSYDPAQVRRQRRLSILVTILFNLGLASALGIWVLAHFGIIGPQ